MWLILCLEISQQHDKLSIVVYTDEVGLASLPNSSVFHSQTLLFTKK